MPVRVRGAARTGRPAGGVGDDPADVGIEVGRVGLVARPEVDDPAATPPERAAAAEDLAALEPADEDEFVRRRDVEVLAVHLLLRQDERLVQALGDGMRRIHDPQPLGTAVLAPLEVAGRAHEPLEDPREVAGMEDDQAHAVEDPGVDPLDDRVAHLVVGDVAPPGQDVRLGKDRLGQAVLRLVQGGGPDLEAARLAAGPRRSRRGSRSDRWPRPAGRSVPAGTRSRP